MADEEEDDPVVHEIDVFLAKSLAEKLYLFQYPMRPGDMPYDHIPHLGARIKPQQQKVELELAINTNSSNYYIPRGEQIASDVDSQNKGSSVTEKESYYTSDRMDKQVLTSSKASVSPDCFVVGLLKPGELHLTPLHGLLQLRPSFEYLNKGEASVKQLTGVGDEADSQDEEEEAKAVTVRFARPETDKAKANRLSSYKYLEKKQAEEPWIDLNYYSIQESVAREEQELLQCLSGEVEATELSLKPREYLKLLVPSTSKQERSKPKLPSNMLSMTRLKNMDLPDQVKTLLINAKLMGFSQLCSLLSQPAKEPALLRCVQQYAVMVQGCWVVKSELLYPANTTSSHSGVAAEILCRGRDYIMWRFNQSRVVVRKDIATVTKLPNEDIKEMLEKMSRMRVAQGWEFLLPFDSEFVNKHPDVYKQQLNMWETKVQILSQQLNLPKGATETKRLSGEHLPGPETKKGLKTPKTKTNNLLHESMSSIPNPDAGSKDRPISPMEIDCQTVTVGLRSDNLLEDLNNRIPVPLSNFEHSEQLMETLKQFVREKLHRTVLSFADFKKLLLLRQTGSEPEDVLRSGVPDALLEKAILATQAVEIDMKWPISLLQIDVQRRRLFAFKSVGDSTDKYRDVLLDMFKQACSVKKSDFHSRTQEVTQGVPTRREWATLQQDLLERGKSAGQWLLRGTAALIVS